MGIAPAWTLNHGASLHTLLNRLNIPLACALLCIGVMIMVTARRHHRVIVVLLSAALGWYLALAIKHYSPAGSIICAAGGTLAGLLLLGIMRLVWVLVSAIVGALFGALVWHSLQAAPQLWWIAAALGFITLGFLASILFQKLMIVACTLLGSAFAVAGGAALLVHLGSATQIHQVLGPGSQWSMHLLAAIIIASLASLVLQALEYQHGKTPSRKDMQDP